MKQEYDAHLNYYHKMQRAIVLNTALPKTHLNEKIVAKSVSYKETSDGVRYQRLKSSSQRKRFFLTKQMHCKTQAAWLDFKADKATTFVLSLKTPGHYLSSIYQDHNCINDDISRLVKIIDEIESEYLICYAFELDWNAKPKILDKNHILVATNVDMRKKNSIAYDNTYKVDNCLVSEIFEPDAQFNVHVHVMCKKSDYKAIRQFSKESRRDCPHAQVGIQPAKKSVDSLVRNGTERFALANYITKANITMGSSNCRFNASFYDAPLVSEKVAGVFSRIALKLAKESSQITRSKNIMAQAYLKLSQVAKYCAQDIKELEKTRKPVIEKEIDRFADEDKVITSPKNVLEQSDRNWNGFDDEPRIHGWLYNKSNTWNSNSDPPC